MSSLAGEDLVRLATAIDDAFNAHEVEELVRMTFSEDLYHYVGRDLTDKVLIRRLLEAFERRNTIVIFLRAVRRARPHRQDLIDLIQKLYPQSMNDSEDLEDRRTHKVLVYVSSGSTCRDPMAKAITDQLLIGRKLKHPVDVYAVGFVPNATQASYGAREAIREMYNADLLRDHKPVAFSGELVDKADLILVMDKKLFNATKDRLPRNKTYILKEFFGLSGDVDNPWRRWGGRDTPETLERYRKCADELKQILSTHMDTLLNALRAV